MIIAINQSWKYLNDYLPSRALYMKILKIKRDSESWPRMLQSHPIKGQTVAEVCYLSEGEEEIVAAFRVQTSTDGTVYSTIHIELFPQ